jgi:nicotinate-nucleotide--dimethylbenzimidazole phosphoribosyltransferase
MTSNNHNSPLQAQLLHKINTKTKPIGALGVLETIALQVGMAQNSLSPVICKPHIVVFAADHGIAATGKVNPYPQSVTAQMVLNFVNGGAAINIFCKQHAIGLTIVDAGVNYDFDSTLPIVHSKIGKGTGDYSVTTAMSSEEAFGAIEKGKNIVANIAATGCNCIGFGEMGIGNTSAASLMMSSITDTSIEQCVGRGTGVNDEQLQIKINTLKEVHKKHALHLLAHQPVNLLSKIGGFEIAMMAGAYLKAAALKMTIVVDGFISTAALLIAKKISEQEANLQSFSDWGLVFAHTSGEQGHEKMLQHLGVKPLLQLGMRLGEGTGAALAIPIIQTAVNFLNEMASFESAGIGKPIG